MLLSATSCNAINSDLKFFRGKTVTIIVSHGSGGGMDIYARMLAPYLQKYLLGSRVEVKNVPEAGGINGKNQVYAAKPDGLTLGFTTGAGALLAEWAGQQGVEYKTTEFSYIGRINAEAHILVVSPKANLRTLSDIIQVKKISMGFPGIGSDDYYVGLITSRILGYQVDTTNFESIDSASLACVRGEVDAILFSESSVRSQIEAQTVLPVVSFSDARPPDLPNVPTIFEVIPPEKEPLMHTLVHIYELERVLIAPPDLPPGRLEVLRDALDKAVEDPEFIANMVKIQRPVNYLTGAETTELLAHIMLDEDQIEPLVLEIIQESR